MPNKFNRAEVKKPEKQKPDAERRVMVRVFLLQDPNESDPQKARAHINNLRKDFFVDGARVSDVAAAVEGTLFGEVADDDG